MKYELARSMFTTVKVPSLRGTTALTQACPPQSLKSQPELASINAGIIPSSSHAGMPAALAIELKRIEKSSQSPTFPTMVSGQLFGTDDFWYF